MANRGRQERVKVPPQKPPDPRDHDCNWCTETAVYRFEIKRGAKRLSSQMYVFACGRHKSKGEQATAYKAREPRI